MRSASTIPGADVALAPMKVITGPDTRWSYANVWEPKSFNGGTPKYSVSLIIPKSDTKTVAKIKAAIEAAYKEGESKLKGNGKSVPALSAYRFPVQELVCLAAFRCRLQEVHRSEIYLKASAGESKLKGNGKSVPALSVIKTPLRDGDLERPDDAAYANA